MINGLAKEEDNCPKISYELMCNLILDINEKGYNDEGKEIIPLLDTLCQNSNCIPSFVLNNGIDTCVTLLNDNDTTIECISSVFNILKNVMNASEEYKKMLQDKKVPDAINRVIKKVGAYDKNLN